MIESVEVDHRQLRVTWDDGLVLDTTLRWGGEWHLYRSTERWRRPWETLSVGIEVHGFTAACFRAAHVETYRQFDLVRHPSFGRQGPDIALVHTVTSSRIAVADALTDPRVVRGVGTVFRSEVLWGAQIHPSAPMSRLSVDDCADLAVRAVGALRASIRGGALGAPLAVYGRNGRRCERCGDTITTCRDETSKLVYFCPGCQVRHHPDELTAPQGIERPMDPHPAAARYLADLPWNRSAVS